MIDTYQENDVPKHPEHNRYNSLNINTLGDNKKD